MIAAVLFAWTTIITDRVCRKHDSLSVGIVYVGIIGAVLILAGILGMRKVQGRLSTGVTVCSLYPRALPENLR